MPFREPIPNRAHANFLLICMIINSSTPQNCHGSRGHCDETVQGTLRHTSGHRSLCRRTMEAAARASTAALSLRASALAAAQRSPVAIYPPSHLRSAASRGLLSSGRTSFPVRKRDLCMAARSELAAASGSPNKVTESFFRSVITRMEKVYLGKNPTASAILDLVCSSDGDRVCYDHFAFRTFGVDGHGIDSMAKFFVDFGYTPRDELRFPAKKLRALWFSPPETQQSDGGTGVEGPLPRIFISELLVDEISRQSQEVIRKYTKMSGSGNKYAALASASGSLTWERPSYSDYQLLLGESEYAAWTLVNGYALNHVTVSTHRLKSQIRDINRLNQFIEDNGYKLNSEGGTLKVSPDGLLLQSSTVADSTVFLFAEGVSETVPCSYIEFAERLLLPQYKNLPKEQVEEHHRRDGFEVGNADKIFESTSKDQLTRNAA